MMGIMRKTGRFVEAKDLSFMNRARRFFRAGCLGWTCYALLVVSLRSPLTAAEDATKTNGSSQVYEVRKILDVPYSQGADAVPAKHSRNLYLPKHRPDFPVLFSVHA